MDAGRQATDALRVTASSPSCPGRLSSIPACVRLRSLRLQRLPGSHRERAVSTLAEAFRFNPECVIKPGTIVLPCNRCREFDHLGLTEFPSQLPEQPIRNFDRRTRHGIGKFQNELFRL